MHVLASRLHLNAVAWFLGAARVDESSAAAFKRYTVCNDREAAKGRTVRGPATADGNDGFLPFMWPRQVSINYLVTDRH